MICSHIVIQLLLYLSPLSVRLGRFIDPVPAISLCPPRAACFYPRLPLSVSVSPSPSFCVSLSSMLMSFLLPR